jgi:hypothetical protein
MMKTAITSPKKTDLCTVAIRTRLGDEYTFPAMDKKALGKVLPKGSNRIPANTPTLAMVNASMAVLSIPLQIVGKVTVDGQDWWDCPA